MPRRILFIPTMCIFESVNKSIQTGTIDGMAHDFFKECMIHKVDYLNRVIYISPEMKSELEKKGHIPKKIKRLSLFQIVGVHPESISGDYLTSLKRLATMLTIQTDIKIYVVCDNPKIRAEINKTTTLRTISSETAIELLISTRDEE